MRPRLPASMPIGDTLPLTMQTHCRLFTGEGARATVRLILDLDQNAVVGECRRRFGLHTSLFD